MFSTRLEVDRHVENCLKKINSETERNLRCLAFAKLYFKVGEYEQARRYVSSYLSAKPLSAEGQLLLGKILEKLGKKEAALEAYRSSYELDSKQNSLVVKICELLSNDSVNLDVSTAKYFCEKAQSLDPHNPFVFTLKERLVTLECKDPGEVSRLLLTELETRPTDVKLRIRLLRHFLQNNQIKDAYKHAADIEEKNLSIFLNSLSWYETVAQVLIRYQRDASLAGSLGHEYWMLLISVLDKIAALSLDEHSDQVKNTAEYVATVFNLDQTLMVAAQHLSASSDRDVIQEFLCHYRGQLCFHLATLMYKQAKKDLLKFKEVENIVLPLLFVAYHSQPAELNSLWLKHASGAKQEQMKRWHKETAYRCSQAGHVIMAGVRDRKRAILEKALLHSSGLWREQLYKKLFVKQEQQNAVKNSYFVTCPQIADVVIKPPEAAELAGFDGEAQLVHPDSLHHYIWLCLNQELHAFKCASFPGLQYSVKNLKNCSAETLSVLDIQAFIYCAALCAKSNVDASKVVNLNRPSVLPAAVTEQLGTPEQMKWLTAAYRMYRNEYGGDLSEIRLRLIKGLETVRCVGNHGLDPKLLVLLAKAFAECARNSSSQSEIEHNEARAELYWKAALVLLERLKNNHISTPGGQRLFTYKRKELDHREICESIDSGRLFIASQLMKQKEHEKALQLLEQLKDPYASFYQAKIYRSMAEEQMEQNKDSVTFQMQNQYVILLTKAKDCLYLTLDRLRDPSVDRKHPLNTQLGTEIEEVERALASADSVDDDESTEHLTPNYSLSQSSFLNGSILTMRNDSQMSFSTPSRRTREARPSPERLDAQLRQLMASKDATIGQMMDQNRIIVDSQRCLVDELKGFKEAVKGLTTAMTDTIKHTVDELKGIKETVEDLKTSVDELQSFRNVTDLVYEIKKELGELKKDTGKAKSAQLSDEDLYPLDEEFAGDYNIGQSVAGFTPNLFQQGRMPGATPFAYGSPALYSPMYPMAPYHYGLGLPQAGALPFGAEQHIAAELRAMNALPQNLSQTALTQANFGQSVLPPTLGQQFAPTSTALLPNQSQFFKEPASATANVFSSIPPSAFPTSAAFPATSVASSKAAPVNVVITASDPLPTNKPTAAQPILSVTIPPQHLKGNLPPKSQPHNYQIPLPAASVATVPAPSVLNQSPLAISTQSILSNVAPPVYSAIPEKSAGLGLQIEKSLSQSFSSKDKAELNRSDVSAGSVEEVDPCPDFKPIIPLPDEVPVNTGEENEKVLFCERAKLYRYVNKEWRERGVGDLKILHNPETDKVRVLMRRDQVHKICANHFITKETTLTPMTNSDRAYVWAANDFADEEVVLEKLCARFKTPEEAKKFYNAFQDAVKLVSAAPETKTVVPTQKVTTTTAAATLGGFVFTSTPTFKPKEGTPVVTEIITSDPPKPSPFADFSFVSKPAVPSLLPFTPEQKRESPGQKVVPSSPGDDQSATDFVPTAEFKPVVPLPAIVDVKTGEENSEVLHECRAKLLRYDTGAKEWKERGLGMMKILKEDKVIRLLMRREQVHKVCCNHQLLRSMEFAKMPNNPKALNWYAQDFSEETLKPELFALRFKTEEQADEFLAAVKAAQASLGEKTPEKKAERNQHAKMKTEPEKSPETPKQSGSWGERFKPKSGTWNCKTCYVMNEGKDNYCVACETPKNASLPKTDPGGASGPTFSFGVPTSFASPSVPNQPKPASGFGDQFKPKEGSWNCKNCYIINEGKDNYCVACESPKYLSETGASDGTLSFASPHITTPSIPNQSKPASGFGDQFKPKEGSWECKTCFVRNDSDKSYCVSCECPKDDTIPKKQQTKGIDLSTPGKTFTFGIPQPNATTTQSTSFGLPTTPTTTQSKFAFGSQSSGFVFGASSKDPAAPLNLSAKPFAFMPPEQLASADEKKEEAKPAEEKFVFGSPQKHSFEFTPRSPRKLSGCHGDEESDGGSYVEEEADNIYFKPVIPLPDKVEVKTGEEGEEVLYNHRAKLFRFVDSEWKERGIGDVKILFHREMKKLRVVMRREQVLKICLNHVLTPEIEYLPKDDKTWLFSAPDFSEGEILRQQFCLRFKSAEIAQDFKKAVESSLKKITDKNESVADAKADSDVELVSETTVTPAEEKEAVRLGLPPKFFAYKQLPDCKCEQCKKDDVYLKELFEPEQKSSFLFGTPKTSSSSLFHTPDSRSSLVSNFGSCETSSVSTKTSSPSQMGAIEQLLIKPSLFSSLNLSANKTQSPTGSQSTPKVQPSTDAFKTFTFTLNPTPPASAPEPSKPVFGSGFAFGSTSIFGGGQAAATSNVFGSSGSTASATPLFGSNTSLFTTSNTSLFGGGLAENGAGSIFGSGVGSVFGSNAPSFGALAKGSDETSLSKAQGAPATQADIVLHSDPNLTFASLAKSSQEKPAFGKKTDDGKNPFEFLGAGAPVFGGAPAKQATAKKVEKEQAGSGDEAENEEENGGEEYDPHYEPIVPLPAAIVVSTGEEEESVLFNERAKLFRYDPDTKEWKERGVGQIKVLHHPINNTYRLLLRREQVHKLVLNQLITVDLDLQPLSTSDKAWCWGGYNHTDDGSSLERLALRFKNSDLARLFFETVQKAVAAVKDHQANKCLPSTILDYGVEDVSGDENQPVVEEVDDEDDEDDDDDEEDDRSVMCAKRCTLSEQVDSDTWKPITMGDIQIYYDPELYGAKIAVTDDNGQLVSNTVIGVNTVMELKDTECEWRAVEWANEDYEWKSLKATFSSAAAALEFYCSYKEGVNYAQEFDIVDEIPTEHSEEIS